MSEYLDGADFGAMNGHAPFSYGAKSSQRVTFYKRDVWVEPFINDGVKVRDGFWKKDQVYCRIETAGDKNSIWDQPVREKDKAAHRAQWERFLKGEDCDGGTPLSELKDLPRDLEDRLRYYHIHTLEQAASMSDSQLGGLGLGAREVKERALRHLREKHVQKEASKFTEIKEENKTLRELLEATNARLAALESKSEAPAKPVAKSQHTAKEKE